MNEPQRSRAPKKGNQSHTTRLAHAFKRESGYPYTRAKEIVERAARAGLLPEPIDVDEMRPALEVLRRLDKGDLPVRTTAASDEPCHAARTGEGYWTCDAPGGCEDCRALAAEIDDTEQLDEWAEADKASPARNPPVMSHQYGLSSHARVLSGPATGPLEATATRRLQQPRCDVCERVVGGTTEPYWFVIDSGRPEGSQWANDTGVVCARHLPDFARHRRFSGDIFDRAASKSIAVPRDPDSDEMVEARVAREGTYLTTDLLRVLRKVWQGRVTREPCGPRSATGTWLVGAKSATEGDVLRLTLLEDRGYIRRIPMDGDPAYARADLTGFGMRVLSENGADTHPMVDGLRGDRKEPKQATRPEADERHATPQRYGAQRHGIYVSQRYLEVLRQVAQGRVAKRVDADAIGGFAYALDGYRVDSVLGFDQAPVLILLERDGYIASQDDTDVLVSTEFGRRVLAAVGSADDLDEFGLSTRSADLMRSRGSRDSRTPYVGTGADGALRSAAIDESEMETLPTDKRDPFWTKETEQRRVELAKSAARWRAQAATTEQDEAVEALMRDRLWARMQQGMDSHAEREANSSSG